MAKSTFTNATSFQAIPTRDLEDADEVKLKTIAHSLLESKFEKLMSTAGSADQLNTRKRLAVEWMKKWDLDGDGVLSSLEMKGAAMEHVRLQRDFKTRGIWILVLIILTVCCGGVILGVSIWANAISKDSKVETGDDLGGYTMRKKDGSAVVKTATALYEFVLPRIAYVPFDELSTIESISFLFNKTMRQMSVVSFKWYGTNNITFYSGRGERLSVVKPTEETVTILLYEPRSNTPVVIFDDLEPDILVLAVASAAIDEVAGQNMPLTTDNVLQALAPVLTQMIAPLVPEDCVAQFLRFYPSGNDTALQGFCSTMVTSAVQASGIVEAKVGPQDSYGTELSAQERADLRGFSVFADGNVYLGQMQLLNTYKKWIGEQIKARGKA